MSGANVPKEEVQRFLEEAEFSGYQSVPLPHGLRTPGNEKKAAVEFYLHNVSGKTVLDIGTYYGLYPCEAIRRGATRAVGLEPDPKRFEIAQKISSLHGGAYTILNTNIEQFESSEKYDVVLLLNVIHHVLDPIEAVCRAARLSKGTMLVEFCLPWDTEYLKYIRPRLGKWAGRIYSRLRSAAIRATCADLPIMAVGSRAYHRTFYFSREAFRNVFVVHHGIFSSIDFAPSPTHAHRAVAICRVRQN